MSPQREDQVAKIRARLSGARSVVVLTGAGISADSGIPTFRGADGLWRQYRAEDLATPGAFRRDPRLVWEWYNWRRELIGAASPNAGHYAVSGLERTCPGFFLITQNVDGLHEQAGSRKMVELHGSIWKVRCTQCGEISENRHVPLPSLPSCGACGGLLRPHVVWFGESLDPEVIARSCEAVEQCDFLLVVGTSGVVQPASSFISMARNRGSYVVDVNMARSLATDMADEWLPGRAKDILPLLVP